jgi:hypothetical protein
MGWRGQHTRDEDAEREWRKLAARRRSFSSTPPRSRRIAPPVAATYGPPRLQVVISIRTEQSAQTYPAFRQSRWPRWRSARPDPHKGDGVERHLPPRVSGHQSIVRPSFSYHPQILDGRRSAAVSLPGYRRSFECSFVTQKRPDNPSHFCGQSDDDCVCVRPRQEAPQPLSYSGGVLGENG